MILKQCILVNNDCYKKGTKISGNPTGIVVHSTGANNPYLKRYVQPLTAQSDYAEIINDIGKNTNNNDWNRATGVCVHAFIGKNTNGKVETYQTMPFDVCCWGCGSGSKGSYNYNPTARLQFEICEDSLSNETYFSTVMKEAQEFCAYLCKKFGFGVDKICSHHESYVQKYGSNHADIDHWLVKFGKNMDWFRAEVQKLLGSITTTTAATQTSTNVVANSNNNETVCYNYLTKTMGLNVAAACGVMASISAESGFMSNNLQNSFECKFSITDDEYVQAVDNGTYTNFIKDSAGFGLFQWTYWSRKQALLNFAKSKNVSIGDLNMQLDFFAKEIASMSSVFSKLKTMPNTEDGAYQAGYLVCYDYESPASKETKSVKRGNKAKEYFKKYSGSTANTTVTTSINTQTVSTTLKVGDIVTMSTNATIYGRTSKFASFIYKSKLYVREVSGNRIVISTQKTGAVTGAVDRKYLTKV